MLELEKNDNNPPFKKKIKNKEGGLFVQNTELSHFLYSIDKFLLQKSFGILDYAQKSLVSVKMMFILTKKQESS